MRTKSLLVALLGYTALCLSSLSSLGQGTAFTYQGRLNTPAGPASGSYDLQFTVYDAANNPANVIAGPAALSGINVSNGLFSVLLDFGSTPFNGSARWLEIAVRTNGATSYFTLSPRQAITPSPYSIAAATLTGPVPASQLTGAIPSANLSGTYANPVTLNNAQNQFTGSYAGDGTGVTNVNAATLNGLASSNLWQTGGNTVTSGQFLGSMNNQPVELWANGSRALRLEPGSSPNIVAGSASNAVRFGQVGATIAGGGTSVLSNYVVSSFGTVGGGEGNTAQNLSTVGGGYQNGATGLGAVVAGGGYDGSTYAGNTASGNGSAVGGGNANTASGLLSSVTGGNNSQATGAFATVAGGQFNSATGTHSFAAGRKASAGNGSFVWADETDATFQTTGANQFLVRAAGGVGINTNNPNGSALNVLGNLNATSLSGNGANLTSLNASQLTSGTVPSAQLAGTYASALTLNNAANSFTGNGAGLTTLNAANLSSGTLADGRLSANVPLLNANQTFSGRNSFNQGLGIGTTSTLEGALNINTNAYLFSHPLYLRGETGLDHNHGLAYNGNFITNFGTGNVQVDGPVLWGFAGGALGVASGEQRAALTWNGTGVTIAGTLSATNTPGLGYNDGGAESIFVSQGATVRIANLTVNKPATGYFFLVAYILLSNSTGNYADVHLLDVTSGTTLLLGAWIDGTNGSTTITYAVPVTAPGGTQTFAIEVVGSAGSCYVRRHDLAVMYFPRAN